MTKRVEKRRGCERVLERKGGGVYESEVRKLTYVCETRDRTWHLHLPGARCIITRPAASDESGKRRTGEQRAESREAGSREQRAESREQRAESSSHGGSND